MDISTAIREHSGFIHFRHLNISLLWQEIMTYCSMMINMSFCLTRSLSSSEASHKSCLQLCKASSESTQLLQDHPLPLSPHHFPYSSHASTQNTRDDTNFQNSKTLEEILSPETQMSSRLSKHKQRHPTILEDFQSPEAQTIQAKRPKRKEKLRVKVGCNKYNIKSKSKGVITLNPDAQTPVEEHSKEQPGQDDATKSQVHQCSIP